MAFDFPTSPAEGQVYSPAGGPKFVYYAPAWRQVTTEQKVQIATAETRNRIVNPAFQISQENGDTASTVNAYYPADQWQMSYVTSGTMWVTRHSAIPTPNGSKHRLIMQPTVVDTSAAPGELWSVYQTIEGSRIADFRWGSGAAKQVVLRFGVNCGVAGTFGGAVRNPGVSTRSYVFSYTITAGEVGQDVYRTIVIPGEATGTWPTDTAAGMTIYFTFMSGTTYTSPVGWNTGNFVAPNGMTNGAATSVQFHVFDVGLYRDPNNTGVAPPFEVPDYAAELQACQRYWINFLKLMPHEGYISAGGVNVHRNYLLPVTMRGTPAVTFSVTTYGAASAVTEYNSTDKNLGLYVTPTAAGQVYAILDAKLSARM